MKLAAVILFGLFSGAAWAEGNLSLSQVKSVYLLPMGNAFDQYLANRITNKGLFEVVTDAKRADAVWTDRLGPGFEARLDELLPAPVVAEAKPAPAKPGDAKSEVKKDAKSETKDDAAERGVGNTKATGAVPTSTFGRAKGTLFLVDLKSRRVLWSTYERPKDATSRELNRSAGRVADEIERALTPDKK